MKEIFEQIHKDKKLLIIIVFGLVGVLLLLFCGNDGGTSEVTEKSVESITTYCVNSAGETEALLEKKLISIVSQVKGAGKISAVVNVASSGEYIYAENVKENVDDDSLSKDSEIVLYEAKNGVDSGLIVGIKNPDIIGVAIVCEGGDSAVIKAEITNLVTSLFGIGADRVYVGTKAVY